MIQKMIDEINIALNNGLYLVALTSALTLPDVCGKAEYPGSGNGERYRNWYSKYVKDSNIPAEQVYALRNSLLHAGKTKPDQKNDISFVLLTNQYTNPLGIDFCFNIGITHTDGSTEQRVKVYVGFLCTAICKAAKEYYYKNKDKFSFLNYEIYDIATTFVK